MRWIPLLLIACSACLHGCAPEHSAACTDAHRCLYTSEAIPGRCVFDGNTGCYCAFPTVVCPSGYKWFSGVPEALARKCVTPNLLPPDAGSTTCGPPAADAGTD